MNVLLLSAALVLGQGAIEKLGDKGPIDFRCDSMQVLAKPNRSTCIDNVVVRRADLIVCCSRFEGYADDDWQWQRFVCNGDVRARRGDETVWSARGEFDLATSDLVLTGRPHLERGKSHFDGVRVIINVESDRARIIKPQGVFVEEKDRPKVANVPTTGALPATCPIEVRPVR